MSSRDPSYRPPSSDSEDTPPETTYSQVSMSSVGTPKTSCLSQSVGAFTFETKSPSPSPRIRKPKRKIRKFYGNQYVTAKRDGSGKKFVKVGPTTPEAIRLPSTSRDTAASKKHLDMN